MKTQNQKLVFKKNSVTELNDSELNDVNGGGTPAYLITLITVVFVLGVIEGCSNEVDKDDCDE